MRSEIILILDRSGSMDEMKTDAIGGFNTFIAEQKKNPDPATVTFVQFDDRYEKLAEGQPLADVKPLDDQTFQPRGSTALLDAIGRTITEQGDRFSQMALTRRPEKVIVCVITDGLENASRHYTRQAIFGLISQQRDQWNWSFYFVGANQDAYGEAGQMGIQPGQVLNTNKGGYVRAMTAMGQNVNSTRGSGQSLTYTSSQVSAALGEDDDETTKVPKA